MYNIDYICELRFQQYTEIKNWAFFEYEQFIKNINDKNEKRNAESNKQTNNNQNYKLPNMSRFDGMMKNTKNMMRK